MFDLRNDTFEEDKTWILGYSMKMVGTYETYILLSEKQPLTMFVIGYDLKQVNLYINKLFENVGSLVYEELDESDKSLFQITGIHSSLGERLTFKQVCADLFYLHYTIQ